MGNEVLSTWAGLDDTYSGEGSKTTLLSPNYWQHHHKLSEMHRYLGPYWISSNKESWHYRQSTFLAGVADKVTDKCHVHVCSFSIPYMRPGMHPGRLESGIQPASLQGERKGQIKPPPPPVREWGWGRE